MREFFSGVRFKIILAVFAFLVGIIIYTATTYGSSPSLSSFFGVVFSPFQKVSTSISDKVSNTFDILLNAKSYSEQNDNLRETLDELYSQMIDYDSLVLENEHLKEMLEIQKENPTEKLSAPANVIGRASDIYKSFYIDQGSSSGIKLYDPVISGNSIIGIVSDVELTYSKVTTVYSPEFSYGVYVSRSTASGLIEGSFEYAQNDTLKMKHIDRDSDIEVGDIIVTAGYSGLVPKGKTVGIVSEIKKDKGGLSLVATLEPLVDADDLNHVFVIKSFEGQGSGYDK